MTKELVDCETIAHQMLENSWVDNLIDEQLRGDGFKAEVWADKLDTYADKLGVELSDRDTWDYEKFFQDMYDASEKGLS